METSVNESIVLKTTKKQAQAKAIADTKTFTLYGGAIRGGKSWWLILSILAYAIKYDKSRWIIVRKDLPVMKQTILVSFNRIMEMGLSSFVESFNQSTMTITLLNDSKIIFMPESFDTDKELNRFRGLEINGAAIDEINEIQEQTFTKIFERAGSWNGSPGCPIKILASCNPTNGWVKEKIYNKWKDGTLPESWAYIPAKIFDNPHVPYEYLASLKANMPKYEYEVFVNGNWEIQLRSGGEFYKCFNIDKHVTKCEYNPELALHFSFDENVNPYMPMGIFQIDNKKIMLIDTILGKHPNNTLKWVCEQAVRKYYHGLNHNAGVFVYGDATSQKEDVKIEKGYDLFRLAMQYLDVFHPSRRTAKANPSVRMRGNFINTIFECEYEGISFEINDILTDAINDFTNTKESADGNGKAKIIVKDNITGVSYQQYGHITDLTDYLICYVFAGEYSQYQRGTKGIQITTGRAPAKHGY